MTRVYPGRPPVRALDGIDLTIGPGEMVGIVGPSGSGKSTLLNILGTLDRADSGLVQIDGHDIAHSPSASPLRIPVVDVLHVVSVLPLCVESLKP